MLHLKIPIKVIAYIWSYNEEDFIEWTIKHLISQNIEIHLFDNWSTDSTFDKANKFTSKYLKVSKWPKNEERYSSLTSRLNFLEELSRKNTTHDWIIHQDVDEIRRAKTGETLVNFIKRIDSQGFNAINHDIETYLPKEDWDGSQNPEMFFTAKANNHTDKRTSQIKCWKNTNQKINLSTSGGHILKFPGIKISSEKLLIKHYPLRTQEHARRKIQERKKSYTRQELKKGWHTQYKKKWWQF